MIFSIPGSGVTRVMTCFVYVLGTIGKNRHLTYVGWTTDLDRRLARHNAGTGARSTRGRIWVLLHCERFKNKRAAMSREWHLKRDRTFRKKLAAMLFAGVESWPEIRRIVPPPLAGKSRRAKRAGVEDKT